MTESLDFPPVALPPLGDVEGTGLIGNRHLIAVQTFDIARLTTHPIPLVSGDFIAVSGQGPKGDSNGSGKTSFLAAVSLLLGEAQWRLEANGSQYAPGLLFSPASAGLDPSGRFSRAERGYIVGVFAREGDLPTAVITVWMRIAQSAPYIKVRWTKGLCVPDGDNDLERHLQSDAMWNGLPRSSEMGAKTFQDVLYGDAPRCMAYLDTPMRPSTPSLLSQQMTDMTPTVIGEALIDLTGRQGLLEKEEKQRALLAEKRDVLTTRQGEDTAARLSEQVDLDSVGLRDRARQDLQQGEQAWRLHYAKGYLTVTVQERESTAALDARTTELKEAEEQLARAQSKVDELRKDTNLEELARQAADVYSEAADRHDTARDALQQTAGDLTRLTERRTMLVDVQNGWSGATVPEAESSLKAAKDSLVRATASRVVASRDHQESTKALADAEAGAGGPAGEALEALRNAGVAAVSLLDVLTISDAARAAWEPRLWPHRGSVVIDAADEKAAVQALTSLPGAAYILADGPLDSEAGALPEGISSNASIGHFLAAVEDQVIHRTNPDRVVHVDFREAVLGGFPSEIAGRPARIAAAQALVTTTEGALEVAQQVEGIAGLVVEAADDDLTAARAVVETALIKTQIDQLQAVHQAQEGAVKSTNIDAAAKRTESVTAAANASGHGQQITNAAQAVILADNDRGAKRTAHAEAQTKLNNLNAEYWRHGWGDSEQEAEALLNAQDDATRRVTVRGLRGRAADALNDALNRYETSVGGVLPPALAVVRQRREQLRDNEPGISGISVEFSTAAGPLRDALDERVQTDADLHARITYQQTTRGDAILTAREASDIVQAELDTLRDGIRQRLEHSLNKISEAWNRLSLRSGGFGAKLKIADIAPSSATSPWTWEVTPLWRRSSTAPYVSYKENANGAQVKLYAIQLVLAALLAADGAKGRVLVLDELGNSLGDVNRKDALQALSTVAREQDVTILGTCQDSVIGDAAGACGQILWFSHATESDAYNQPTRMWGFDSNGERVSMTAPWITSGRTLV